MSDYIDKFAGLSDADWLAKMKYSIYSRVIDGVSFPGFPDPNIQSTWVGSSNECALDDAYKFYVNVKRYCKSLGMPLCQNSRILDFGVGWGRILRFFLKEVDPDNIFGVDVDPNILRICEQTELPSKLSIVSSSGPTDFDSESFDLIYAYSVFSHLSEPTHIEWIKEFARILKPRGVLIVTTWSRGFIDFCTSLSNKSVEIPQHPPDLDNWYMALSTAFSDTNSVIKAYNSGKFIYASTTESSFYGDAIISEHYVKRNWTKYLNLYDFVDNPNRCPQAMIVMQKGNSINAVLSKIYSEFSNLMYRR